ncbi:hypothetical protein [Pseudoxanthomonas sp. PXM01]|uniref:hypothetical protein n=1 Tax=Pseudoxanthomonas sp. PXM01 TaxID=2769295 RepID=UPI0017804DF9|nr:hypothetical protein [Pseudoxanthomonas sp. PXM01]MBD9471238.1 hypothetical protein [Pseudoxanthomonas sp. PXM01]
MRTFDTLATLLISFAFPLSLLAQDLPKPPPQGGGSQSTADGGQEQPAKSAEETEETEEQQDQAVTSDGRTVSNSMQIGALRASIVEASDQNCGYQATRESADLVTAAVPVLVDAGFAFLSAAFRSASGVDNKTTTSQAMAPGSAYSLSAKLGNLDWALSNKCLLVTGGPDNSFKALFGLVLSPDRSAYRLDLYELAYPKQLRKGRKVEGMALAFSMRDSSQRVLSSAIFSGPFLPSQDLHRDPKGEITSGWMALPPISGQTKTNLERYRALCQRKLAYALRHANSLKGAAKSQALSNIVADEAPCGLAGSLPIEPPINEQSWDAWSNLETEQLYMQLIKAMPVTFVVDITETRNVNQFLLNLSQALGPEKNAALKTAVVNMLDPQARKAQDLEDDTALIDYQLARSNFDSATFVYKEAAEITKAAESVLAAAIQSGDNESIIEARGKLSIARTDQFTKKQAVISSYKLMLSAASAAGIGLNHQAELSLIR